MLFEGPAAVRYPRGTGPGTEIQEELTPLAIGKGRKVREGSGVAILNFGTLLTPALEAAEKLGATVADMRFVKPLDEALVLELAEQHALLVDRSKMQKARVSGLFASWSLQGSRT
jgi:1-deoxy-D-xylulose-5-phosphate synthase